MGKMTLGGEQSRSRGGKGGSPQEGGVELLQLLFRECQEEALEKDDRLAEAGIQVVMGGIEQVPFALRVDGEWVVQLFRGAGEGLVEILNQFEKSRDFMKKLRALAEEDAAADPIEAGGTAASGLLKILGIERTEIRDGAKVLGMSKHGAEKSQERVGKPLAKSRSHREGLMRFGEAAIAAKTNGFIQIDTKHGVGRFKSAQRVHVGFRFFSGERGSPILRHRANTKRRKSETQCRPPRDESKSFGSITKLLRIDNI
jgi:hypothetical protein